MIIVMKYMKTMERGRMLQYPLLKLLRTTGASELAQTSCFKLTLLSH